MAAIELFGVTKILQESRTSTMFLWELADFLFKSVNIKTLGEISKGRDLKQLQVKMAFGGFVLALLLGLDIRSSPI